LALFLCPRQTDSSPEKILKLDRDPLQLFRRWFYEASDNGVALPEASCLSTMDVSNYPDGRMVLVKSFDLSGFIFYTNVKSNKGKQLQHNPKGSLTFYWGPIKKQVRIQGDVSQVSKSTADSYFSTRPRGSQLGAWASCQSTPLSSREELERKIRDYDQQFSGHEVPRPPYWNGYRLLPHKMEFWRGRDDRLHDRFVYERFGNSWKTKRLYP